MAANPPDPRWFGVTQQAIRAGEHDPEEVGAEGELEAERRGTGPIPARGWRTRISRWLGRRAADPPGDRLER